MNENNLVRRLSYLTPGDGFRKVQSLYLLSNMRDASGFVLTGATVPAVAALEANFYGLQVVTGQTFMGKFTWVVPADYDEGVDFFEVLVACNMAGNTNSGCTLTASIFRKRPVPNIIPDDLTSLPAGLALSADLGAPTSTTTIPVFGGLVSPGTRATPPSRLVTFATVNWEAFTVQPAPQVAVGSSLGMVAPMRGQYAWKLEYG